MRLFIAVEFSEKFKTYIKKIQHKIRDLSIKGRWTYIDNLHLTLNFLGEIEKDKINDIKNAICKSCIDINSFKIVTTNIGYFQGETDFKVVWLGIKKDMRLINIHKNLENELSIIGFQEEKRKFKPHITIGRNVFIKDGKSEFKIIESQFKPFEFFVNKIVLFKSEQIGKYRVYKSIFEKNLI